MYALDMRCLGCGYDLGGLAVGLCPECARPFDPEDPHSYLSANRRRAPSRGLTLALGVAMIVTHCIVVIGAGHGAAPIGLFYVLAPTGEVNFGPGGWRLTPVLIGYLGMLVAVVAPVLPSRLARRWSLRAEAVALGLAWLYFLSKSERVGGFSLILSIPFIAAMAASIWWTRRSATQAQLPPS